MIRHQYESGYFECLTASVNGVILHLYEGKDVALNPEIVWMIYSTQSIGGVSPHYDNEDALLNFEHVWRFYYI